MRSLGLVALVAMTGCLRVTDTPTCTPGAIFLCECSTGAEGTRVCDLDGRLSACRCPTPIDAGVPSAECVEGGGLDAGAPQLAGCFGAECLRAADCASGVCLGAGHCTKPCARDESCPPGWLCRAPVTSTSTVCTCTPHEERCNGLDDDCNGLVDDVAQGVTMGDPSNCGACGHACVGGARCEAGACACAPGFTLCEGRCVQLDRDLDHCGRCGAACPSLGFGATCASGRCLQVLSPSNGPSSTSRGHPFVASGGHVYWRSMRDSSVLVRVAKSGGPPEVVVAGSSYVSFVSDGPGGVAASTGAFGAPGGIVLLSDAGQQVVASGVQPNALAGNQHRVYWRAGTEVFWFPGRDGGVESLDAGDSPAPNGWSLAAGSDGVFWNDENSEVLFTPEDGGATSKIGQAQGIGSIAARGSSVVWTNIILGSIFLVRAPGSSTEVAAFGQLGVEGLALDESGISWVIPASPDVVPAQVVRRPLDGGASYGVANQNDQQLPVAIAADATSLYWLNSDGSVVKCTPK